jgi:PIN domain nuclease of toxin-antitoxin system
VTRSAYLDTHVAINLAQKTVTLSRKATHVLESSQMLFSPVVQLELAFLWEIRRIRVSPDEILSRLRTAIGLQMCTLSFAEVIYSSASLSWTRNVFDRLMVGQAIANGQAPLITFDELIAQHYRGALC